MKPPPFTLSRPTTVERCLEELAHGEGAKILAGGQSLMPLLNLRLARVERLIDINRVETLQAIHLGSDGVTLGALVRHHALETATPLVERLSIVPDVVGHIGFLAIRHRGTIGGSLAHADPAGELPALMTLLEARVGICSAERGRREIAMTELLVGLLTTSLREDELIVDVAVPWPTPREFHGFWEFALRIGDFARIGALVKLRAADHPSEESSVTLVLFGSELTALRVSTSKIDQERPSPEAVLEAALDCCRTSLADDVLEEANAKVAQWAMTATKRAVAEALVRRSLAERTALDG